MLQECLGGVFSIDITLTPSRAVRLYEQEQGELFRSPPCSVCTEVASPVATECEIKECFDHDPLI